MNDVTCGVATYAHMLALDYGLRPVLSALSAQTILPSIYAVDHQIVWSESEGLDLAADVAARLNEGASRIAGLLGLAAALASAYRLASARMEVALTKVRCPA